MLRRPQVLLLVMLVACGSSEPVPEELPASEVVAGSVGAMEEITSAGFFMEVTGAPVEVEGLEFVSASGDYTAPESAMAELEMRLGSATVRLLSIGIGERVWVTDPLTGAWTELAPGIGFNPASVFGREGWVRLLGDLDGPSVATEAGVYRLTGTIAPDLVARLTAEVVADQAVEITLTVDADSFRVVGARFTTQGEEGSTDWRIELGPFDNPTVIEPPASG